MNEAETGVSNNEHFPSVEPKQMPDVSVPLHWCWGREHGSGPGRSSPSLHHTILVIMGSAAPSERELVQSPWQNSTEKKGAELQN